MKLFTVADTHFFHKNIMAYCERPFDDIHHMNNVIRHCWNSVVTPDDLVIHCGDFALSSKSDLEDIFETLNGQIVLIMGNHDRFSYSFYTKLFKFVCEGLTIKNWIFTHEPLRAVPNGFLNIHGHVHNNKNAERWISADRRNVSVEMIDYTPVELIRY